MRFLLDTNIVSDLVRNPQGRCSARIAAVGESNICTSIIVASELRYGALKKASIRLTRQLATVFIRARHHALRSASGLGLRKGAHKTGSRRVSNHGAAVPGSFGRKVADLDKGRHVSSMAA